MFFRRGFYWGSSDKHTYIKDVSTKSSFMQQCLIMWQWLKHADPTVLIYGFYGFMVIYGFLMYVLLRLIKRNYVGIRLQEISHRVNYIYIECKTYFVIFRYICSVLTFRYYHGYIVFRLSLNVLYDRYKMQTTEAAPLLKLGYWFLFTYQSTLLPVIMYPILIAIFYDM